MTAAATRRVARERALGLLYESDVKELPVGEILVGLPVQPDPYAVDVARGASERLDEIDGLLSRFSHDWSVARMPATDRAILRMAVFELLARPDVPTGVVISEAVALAGEYSTDESTRFVNGLLARIAREVRVARTLTTIGVYGFTADTFIAALRDANVRLVIDVRQRRGVRGAEYAWANSTRLQEALATADIGYHHHKELAPTTELRELQYAEDDRLAVGKRSRTELATEYAARYTTEILDVVDLASLVGGLPTDGAAALLCVEQTPGACHRSLIAARLADGFDVTVTHLVP